MWNELVAAAPWALILAVLLAIAKVSPEMRKNVDWYDERRRRRRREKAARVRANKKKSLQ